MREVQKKNYCYSNDEYLSVFVGVCKSQELLDQYLEQDYELLNEYDCIGSEFGIDFGINFYDEDFSVFVVNPKMSKDLEEVFVEAEVFDMDLLFSLTNKSTPSVFKILLISWNILRSPALVKPCIYMALRGIASYPRNDV